jgi:hypothetical protein
MPNLGFQLEVLKQAITERAASGDALAASLSQNNFNNPLMQFAVLGALGPDVLSYMPISSDLASFLSKLVPSATSGTVMTKVQISLAQVAATTALTGLTASSATPAEQALAFELFFNPFGAAYSVLFSTLIVPVWPILNNVTDVLNQLDTIVQNQDTFALPGMVGEVEGLQGSLSSLAGLPGTIGVLQSVIAAMVVAGPWMEMNRSVPAPADPIVDRRYEFLRWHHTGEFARNLLSNAKSQNQQAFAFGWLCHVASSVTAEPFVNNIVGGPYRTHWWRNRLASNFVDSWTFGFFEQSPLPTMAGDNPTPAYADPQTGTGWPSICNANLQNLFNVANLAGPSTPDGVPDAVTAMASGDISTLLTSFPFPAEITSLLNDTIDATYTAPLGSTLFPAATLPIAGLDASGAPIQSFTSTTFASAYIGAFAVYWFMTSGRGVIGNNPTGVPTGQPEPGWIASSSSPSPQQAGLNVGGAICAAILAILAVSLIFVGDLPAGAAALIAAVSAPIINWDTVANELFWLRKILVDQENLLRDALVWTGMAYPPPVLLGVVDVKGNTLPVTDLTPPATQPTDNVPATTGTPLCKTNAFTLGNIDASFAVPPSYPRWLDKTNSAASFADANFVSFPVGVTAEEEITENLIAAGLYPNALIQAGAGVLNGGMAGPGATWPTAGKAFGDAVANAVQIIAAQANGLPDYNLDADRGYGWQTWDPQAGTNPVNPPVQVQTEP